MSNELELTIPLCECTCGLLGCWSNQRFSSTPATPAPAVTAKPSPPSLKPVAISQQHAVKQALPKRSKSINRNPPGSIERPGVTDFRDAYQDESLEHLEKHGIPRKRPWTQAEFDYLRSLPVGVDILATAKQMLRPYHSVRIQLGHVRAGRV